MTRRLYDVKVYLPHRSTSAWRAEYDSAWDALAAACAHAEKSGVEVLGASAIRVPDPALDAPDVAPEQWDCGCGNTRVPMWCVRCDRCGAARPAR